VKNNGIHHSIPLRIDSSIQPDEKNALQSSASPAPCEMQPQETLDCELLALRRLPGCYATWAWTGRNAAGTMTERMDVDEDATYRDETLVDEYGLAAGVISTPRRTVGLVEQGVFPNANPVLKDVALRPFSSREPDQVPVERLNSSGARSTLTPPASYPGERSLAGRRRDPCTSQARPTREPSVLALVEQVYWPYVVVGYVQLALNIVLLTVLLFVFVFFGRSFYTDVSRKVAHQYTQAARHIEQCQRSFQMNRCFDAAQVVPHMREQCQSWERCAGQTPTQLVMNRASLIMETLAEAVNGFMDSISYKSVACLMLLAVLAVMMGGTTLGIARQRLTHDVYQLLAMHPQRAWRRKSPPRTRSLVVGESRSIDTSEDETY